MTISLVVKNKFESICLTDPDNRSFFALKVGICAWSNLLFVFLRLLLQALFEDFFFKLLITLKGLGSAFSTKSFLALAFLVWRFVPTCSLQTFFFERRKCFEARHVVFEYCLGRWCRLCAVFLALWTCASVFKAISNLVLLLASFHQISLHVINYFCYYFQIGSKHNADC